MENLKKSSFQANVTSELNAQLNELRTALGMTNSELLQYLVSFKEKPFKSELSTNQRVELEIQKQLKGTEKINTYSLRMAFGKNKMNPNNVNTCIELYKSEIDQHNEKLSE